MAKTDENLKAAFAGESQANRTYLAFAKAAEKEGFPQVAKLFKAAAEAETVHALNHFNVLGQVKTTSDNLNAAVSGETYEFTKMYPQFIEDAKKKLFKAAAEAETVHALNHFNVLGQVKTTSDNLNAAVSGETYEFTKMYPQFIEDAKKEGNKKALQSFDYANKVETIHADLYKKALESVEAKKDLPKADINVCPICGNTFEGNGPDVCPICGIPKAKFTKIA